MYLLITENKNISENGAPSKAQSTKECLSDLPDVSSMSPKEIKKEKLRIWKDVTVISLSFMCLFTAYNSVTNLQVNETCILLCPRLFDKCLYYHVL